MTRRRHPRAFAVSPLAVVLVLALTGLLAYRAWAKLTYMPDLPGRTTGVIIGSVVLLVACLAAAGGVGALCYFLNRKSEQAAAVGMCLTLLLPVGWFGYQTTEFLMNPPPKPVAPPTLEDRMRAASERSKAQMDAMLRANEEQSRRSREALDEQMRRNREAMTNRPSPFQPAAPMSAPPPAPSPMPRPAPGEGSSQPATSPAAPPPRSTQDPAITAAAERVRKSAEDRVATVAKLAAACMDAATRAPEAAFSRIDERLTKLKSLRQSVTDLKTYLSNFDARAEEALTAAGVPADQLVHVRVRLVSSFHATRRAMACDQIARFIDPAVEEAELLRSKIGKWRLGGDGKVTTTDKDLQQRCPPLRSRIETSTSRRDQLIDQLNGN